MEAIMTGRPPPTPPDNRSHKGPGDPKTAPLDQKAKGGSAIDDPAKRGQQGNTRVNTTPQRSIQDR
jgi:hypothetical protein